MKLTTSPNSCLLTAFVSYLVLKLAGMHKLIVRDGTVEYSYYSVASILITSMRAGLTMLDHTCELEHSNGKKCFYADQSISTAKKLTNGWYVPSNLQSKHVWSPSIYAPVVPILT